MRNWRVWSILLGSVALWAMIIIVLVYDHSAELRTAGLTPLMRRQHEWTLYAIAGFFFLLNAVMTARRIRVVQRAQMSRNQLDSGPGMT